MLVVEPNNCMKKLKLPSSKEVDAVNLTLWKINREQGHSTWPVIEISIDKIART